MKLEKKHKLFFKKEKEKHYLAGIKQKRFGWNLGKIFGTN